jgi:hypothetical protein
MYVWLLRCDLYISFKFNVINISKNLENAINVYEA